MNMSFSCNHPVGFYLSAPDKPHERSESRLDPVQTPDGGCLWG
jgi:hypothetical protein